MNRMSRSLVAGVLAAVVTLGGAAPAAVAAPPADKADKADKVADKTHQGGKAPAKADQGGTAPAKADQGGTAPAKADQGGTAPAKAGKGKKRAQQVVGAKLQRRLEKVADRKRRILVRLEGSTKVARLGEQSAAVQSNIADDLARIEELKEALVDREATREDVAEFRRIRPAVYHRVINQVRLVAALLQQVSTAPVEDPTVEAPVEDPTVEAPVGAPVGAPVDLVQLEALLEKLLGYGATTLRSVLKEHQVEIAHAKGALDDDAEGDDAEGDDAEGDDADGDDAAGDDTAGDGTADAQQD
jgi:hypothetical protein